MGKEIENIELRSEKVRNVIGQIPPRILRSGITLISIFISILLVGTYFFKYNYTIRTTTTIEQSRDSIKIFVKIPVNEKNIVKLGHMVILNFDEIPYLYNERLITEIQSIPNIINISKSGGIYFSKILLPNDVELVSGSKLKLNDKLETDAIIITDKISIFDRMFLK